MSPNSSVICLPPDWAVFSLTYVPYPTREYGKVIGWMLALLSLAPIFAISSIFTITLVRQSVRWGLLLVGLILSTIVNTILKYYIAEPRPEGTFAKGYGMPISCLLSIIYEPDHYG
ncbi:conserved hypothetical protein [Perkinsus marinus ATCC 50983]|uniref:Uncharacterized protein n=1 Tax=Perkinsus marinus (strain ATCC 50983 / TXsc) TaxID=423536 RepID=C5K637_PERM5|nr:conserved hypothetical protein [Perkinsus marinus ATCC 50983]EER20067.1 conserved hypothetical protein [Perkinsus marinus ATCC 50983]|eukprot:XP_002788271.1 conserved hypothetical protein [Perkinsus marinus ATCC 50983]